MPWKGWIAGGRLVGAETSLFVMATCIIAEICLERMRMTDEKTITLYTI